MRFRRFFYFSLLLILIFASRLSAQGAMDFTNYSSSTSTSGMGEEGAALRNSQDAFTFNPANLAFSNNLRLSLFHNPFQFMGSYPMNNLTAAFKFKGIGSFGLQYLRQDFEDLYFSTPNNPDAKEEKAPFYNYALSLGFASEVTDGLSLGLSLKYGRQTSANIYMSSLLFSMGLNYQPEVFQKRINLGFSLMNMGTSVKYQLDESMKNYISVKPGDYTLEYEFPVSSMMHLALSAAPLETDYISTKIQLGLSRYLIGEQDGKNAESSFSALFNNWKDFPQDVCLRTGLSFEWKPLDLGNGFSFYQNYYLGTISPGPKVGPINHYFTHGAEVGVGYKEFAFLMGYSGRWHNVQIYRSILPEKPWETFQFSLEWNFDKFLKRESESKTPAALKNILVSFGGGYNFRNGHLIPKIYDPYLKNRNSLSFSLESAFYMNRNNALIAAIYYTSIPYVLEFPSDFGKYKMQNSLETFGIYSAYRYHPLEALQPLYVQGGPGIVRINPVQKSFPSYRYQTSLNVAMGASLEIPKSSLVVSPELNYQLMLVPLYPNSSAPRLGGENQIALAVKLGYRF